MQMKDDKLLMTNDKLVLKVYEVYMVYGCSYKLNHLIT